MTNRADRASIEAVISERILTAGAAIGLGVPFWKADGSDSLATLAPDFAASALGTNAKGCEYRSRT